MWSCREDIAELSPTFEKVIGAELESTGRIDFEMDNGNLVFIGSTSVARFIDAEAIGFESNTEKAPSITVTDANGNFLFRKMFPLDSQNIDPAFSFVLEDIRDFDRGSLVGLTPLQNGGYAGIIIMSGFHNFFSIPVFIPQLIVLDDNFNLTSTIPVNGQSDWDFRYRPATRVFEFPDGNLGLLHFNDNCICPPGQDDSRFGVFKMSRSGANIWQRTYPDYMPVFGQQVQAGPIGFDENGDLLVISTLFDFPIRTDSLSIFRISASTGDVIQHVKQGGPGEQHFGIDLFEVDEGYLVLKRFDSNQREPVELVEDKLMLSFFDRQFGFIRDIVFNDITIGSRRGAVLTQDGNLTILILENASTTDSGELIKVSLEGEVLWRVKLQGEPTGLIEASDGSLIVTLERQFNDLDSKLRVLKLSSDGML